MCQQCLEENDYDCGLMNDYGGGNVQWWHDYIRYEIGLCNDYWRSVLENCTPNKPVEPTACKMPKYDVDLDSLHPDTRKLIED